ncbi:phosphopyruvate hydratase [Candidatus Similichlamydia laticola]|uniref:Enolase n=1 Tax=Candidatus Similichlamydia laticola TaxID=2170265 RepID=A0A369KHL3_9BACT|nr:phosphopyruvate hydratase [Candidatus Similichlamydia laticola]RDB31254.1 Enolase [Candidatus Similichlamydia laticola]
MTSISRVHAIEILDSRGFPTLQVAVETINGQRAVARVPSGASTGSKEACELRDQDSKRFLGKGVLKAVKNVRTILGPALVGLSIFDQRTVDQTLLDLDSSHKKENVGANAILGVSIAVFKLALAKRGIWTSSPSTPVRLPCPMMNLINGGVHADSGLTFQEFMIRPVGAPSFREGLRWGVEVYQTLKKLLKAKGFSTSVGDEGGFAPRLDGDRAALESLREAITAAGFEPGQDIRLALDCAANEFFNEEKGVYYKSMTDSKRGSRSTDEQIAYLKELLEEFPELDSIEDGLAESDWMGWQKLTEEVGSRCQLVGDDLFVTQVSELHKGMKEGAANAILIKLNQVGTVTETLDVIDLAKKANYICIPSHRSGDTEDDFLADFTVHIGASQIKTGATCRSERTCKYNRLLELEDQLADRALYGSK